MTIDVRVLTLENVERLKSGIQRSKPKNKAALSVINNAEDYFRKNKSKS